MTHKRVLIEALGLSNDSGLGKVSRILVDALKVSLSQHNVTILIRHGFSPSLPLGWKVLKCRAYPWRFWIHLVFPWILLFKRPHHIICLGWTLPWWKPPGHYHLLVCDAGPLEQVKYQTSKFQNKNKRALPIQIKRADQILTISQFSKERIHALTQVPMNRIQTFNPIGSSTPLPHSTASQIKKQTRLLLKKPFMMSLGNIEPKKNYPGLLKAYKLTLNKIPNAPRLVISGHSAWGIREVQLVLKELSLQDHVTLTGHIPEIDVRTLLSNCTIYISSSLYEGWGFPLFEALTYFRPAIYHPLNAQHEYAKGLALAVNCEDPVDLSRAMRDLLQQKEKRDNLTERLKRKMPVWLNYDLKNRLNDILKIL